MIDIGGALQVAAWAFALGVSWDDASALYQAYAAYKQTGKVDLDGLEKSGTLKRVVTAAAHMLADPKQSPKLVSILSGLIA